MATKHDRFALSLLVIIALIAFSFDSFSHIDMPFPAGPTTFYAGQVIDIGWDVYISHGPGAIKVEYSLDDGETFQTIVDGVNYEGQQDRYGQITWVVPAVETDQLRLSVSYEVNTGGLFYNGLYPGENNPQFSIRIVETETLVLENGLNGYDGTRDTTIYEEGDLSNGGGEHIFSGDAGGTAQGATRRALIAFDVASVPSDATIIAASLQLYLSKTIAPTYLHGLHRLTADWGEGIQDATQEEGKGTPAVEGDATWTSRLHPDTPWDTPGGDFLPVSSATAEVSRTIGDFAVWTGETMVEDIKAWVEGETPNYGWILIGREGIERTAKRFYSSENTEAEPGQKPRLQITWIPAQQVRKSHLWALY